MKRTAKITLDFIALLKGMTIEQIEQAQVASEADPPRPNNARTLRKFSALSTLSKIAWQNKERVEQTRQLVKESRLALAKLRAIDQKSTDDYWRLYVEGLGLQVQ
jgi:hypothetical protein